VCLSDPTVLRPVPCGLLCSLDCHWTLTVLCQCALSLDSPCALSVCSLTGLSVCILTGFSVCFLIGLSHCSLSLLSLTRLSHCALPVCSLTGLSVCYLAVFRHCPCLTVALSLSLSTVDTVDAVCVSHRHFLSQASCEHCKHCELAVKKDCVESAIVSVDSETWTRQSTRLTVSTPARGREQKEQSGTSNHLTVPGVCAQTPVHGAQSPVAIVMTSKLIVMTVKNLNLID
jgi:hypothetical protein